MAVSVGQRSMWQGSKARWIAAALIIASVGAYAVYQGIDGSSKAPTKAAEEAAVVEHIDGSDIARVTLSAAAIERLDLRTVPARMDSFDGESRAVIPYGAVLYDPDGETWIYASPKPRTFMRHSITVDSIADNRAVLSMGPPPGTRIVSVGAQELWGAELGIDGSGH